MKNLTFFITLLLTVLLSMNMASALLVNSVSADTFIPGQEGLVQIEVENSLDVDALEVSLVLNFNDVPFIPLGASEKSFDKIDDNDDQDFTFKIKAANDIKPGDYEIPYTLQYALEEEEGLKVKTRMGTIGIIVLGNSDLVYSVTAEDAVEKRAGKITFKIVNKGSSDARFAFVTLIPENFVLLSNPEAYIGTIDSDDYETVDFDVMFENSNARFKAILEYRDFHNQKVLEGIDLPLTVYSEEEALRLGIITPDNSKIYLVGIILIIGLFLGYKAIKKRRRMQKSEQ